jgi:hypothetical protein
MFNKNLFMKKIIIIISLTLVSGISAFAQSKADRQVPAQPANLATVDAQSSVGEAKAGTPALTSGGSLNALPVTAAQPAPPAKSRNANDRKDMRKQPVERVQSK